MLGVVHSSQVSTPNTYCGLLIALAKTATRCAVCEAGCAVTSH